MPNVAQLSFDLALNSPVPCLRWAALVFRPAHKITMAEGYCFKCKAKREILGAVEERMKNGRLAVKGKCPTCSAVIFKILGGKAHPEPSIAPVEAIPGKLPD